MSLQKGFFFVQSSNPNLPPEEWTLVYKKTTAGAYSENLGWGKYKVVMSGGGGSGAAMIRDSTEHGMEFVYCQNGFAGAERTVLLDVLSDETKTFSGTVGSGGSGSTVKLTRAGSSAGGSATYGTVGTGYANGATANRKYEYSDTLSSLSANAGAWVGGSGGGSTSLLVDGVLSATAAGGNGGGARVNYSGYKTSDGGAGGSGGTTSGTGATGGANVSAKVSSTTTKTSGNGAAGYIRIYKSNLKPEPL